MDRPKSHRLPLRVVILLVVLPAVVPPDAVAQDILDDQSRPAAFFRENCVGLSDPYRDAPDIQRFCRVTRFGDLALPGEARVFYALYRHTVRFPGVESQDGSLLDQYPYHNTAIVVFDTGPDGQLRPVAADPDRLARFQREAQVLASLNHPNIAQIHGLEESEGVKALVLEYIEGPTLADRINQGPIPVDEALPIAKQIAEALEAAHEQGIIHRDLKPANVKVKDDGTVKVLDFGLAKAFQPEAADPNMSLSPTISLSAAATQMGMVIGTAAYMAPEQAKGLPVDKRADIWAFGAVLFEMLTGKKLFEAGDVSEMLASVLVKDPDVSRIGDHVPAHIRSVVRHCLVKNPTERLRDIGDVRLAMKGVFETTVAAATTPVEKRGRPLWNRAVVGGFVVLASLVLGGLAVWSITRPATPRVARFLVPTAPPPFVNPGATPDVVLTPDGSRLVYVALVEDRSLYVRAIDQLDAVPLRGAEGAINPFISPDSNWVGYWSAADRALKKVSIDGGPPVTLTASAGIDGASWGTDDTIFFAMRGEPTGLLRVSAAGGDPEQVTTLAEGETAHRWPHILPGGEALLFTVVRGPGSENMEVAALKLDTGERVSLVSGGSNPQYAPTGHLIYGVDGSLRAVPFNPDQLEVTSDPTPVFTVDSSLTGTQPQHRTSL